MRIVNKQIATQCTCRIVVNTAGAICHVGEDQALGSGAKGGDDIGNCGCEEEQPFRELERNTFGRGGADAVDGLVDLEGVVGGKMGNGGV